MTAFNYLVELDQRFLLQTGSIEIENQSMMRTLHFRVAEYDLLLPLNDNTEIISEINYSRIPLSNSWVLGITSRRGQLLTVIDLKNYLFKTERINKIGKKRIIAIKMGTGLAGFVVDSVVGLMSLKKNDFTDQYPHSWDSSLLEMLSGVYRDANRYLGICDFEKLINNERFFELQTVNH